MLDDFTRHLRLAFENGLCTEEEAIQYAQNDVLCYSDSELSKFNKENSDLGLPTANYKMKNVTLKERQIERERDPGANEFYERNKDLLNPNQKNVFNELKLVIDNKRGSFYMIYAPAGCGKSFLINL